MDERALICAWLERYLAELEAAARDVPGEAGARFVHECETVRNVLWAIESGDYLRDFGGSTAH